MKHHSSHFPSCQQMLLLLLLLLNGHAANATMRVMGRDGQFNIYNAHDHIESVQLLLNICGTLYFVVVWPAHENLSSGGWLRFNNIMKGGVGIGCKNNISQTNLRINPIKLLLCVARYPFIEWNKFNILLHPQIRRRRVASCRWSRPTACKLLPVDVWPLTSFPWAN